MKPILKSILLVFLFSHSAFAQLPGNVPSNGLEAFWGFNGNAGDSSGNGNHLTNYGAIGAMDRFGNLNSAFELLSNDYLTIPSPSFQFDENLSFTISFWIKTLSNSQGGWIYASGLNVAQGGSGKFCHFSGFTTLPILDWRINKQGSPWIIASSNNWSNPVWDHRVLVYENKTMTMYQNGVQVATANYTYSGAVAQAMPFHIGTLYSNDNNFYNGSIDDFGIWSRALSQTEIDLLYINCVAEVNIDPSDFASTIGGNAVFGIKATNPGYHYQWQSDISGAFQDLGNNAPYQGVYSDTLNILAVTAAMNGTNFRCVVTSPNVCSDTSSTATLEVCGTIISQPWHQTIVTRSSAVFGVSSSDTGSSYQWQISNGGSFVSLTNNAIYSDVQTDSLKITSTPYYYNGNQYRCIISSGGCLDTSSAAILTVINGVSLAEGVNLKVQIFPNPTKEILNLNIPSTLINSKFRITNHLGQILHSGKLTDPKMTLDISENAVGNYILIIEDKGKIAFSVIN